jgi:hypothetical protein
MGLPLFMRTGACPSKIPMTSTPRCSNSLPGTATPSMVVDRKYATDASRVLASSDEPGDAAFGRLIELTNHLVGNEAALLHLHS